MSKSNLEVFIRRAGPWNAKSIQLSSQLGHIMLCIDDTFYSFTQNKFLPEGTAGCVQVMESKDFMEEYSSQIWHIVELRLDIETKQKILNYFATEAKEAQYSLVNNCTRHCQRALGIVGISFPRDFIFPGSVLRSMLQRRSHLPIVDVKTVTI